MVTTAFVLFLGITALFGCVLLYFGVQNDPRDERIVVARMLGGGCALILAVLAASFVVLVRHLLNSHTV